VSSSSPSPPAQAGFALELLAGRGETLATAESLTGGMLASLLTGVPGASRSFRGGVVSYATELKESLLGVPAEVVAEHGVVSGPCAAAMAEGARRLAGATYAVATTGVAGPDLQEGKPAGLVFVSVAGPEVTTVRELHLDGDRQAVRYAACERALDALAEVLAREETPLG
jgi:nicotinamide-nucleotide amidase